MRPEIYVDILAVVFVFGICALMFASGWVLMTAILDAAEARFASNEPGRAARRRKFNRLLPRMVTMPRGLDYVYGKRLREQWVNDGLPALIQDIWYHGNSRSYCVEWFDGEKIAVGVEFMEDTLRIPSGAFFGLDVLVHDVADYIEEHPGTFRPEFYPANVSPIFREPARTGAELMRAVYEARAKRAALKCTGGEV